MFMTVVIIDIKSRRKPPRTSDWAGASRGERAQSRGERAQSRGERALLVVKGVIMSV